MSNAILILDNEAVQALTDPTHRKHQWVISSVLLAVRRNQDQAASVRLIVPTAVRVESGWDRRTRGAAAVNRLRFEDAALDGRAADRAAAVRSKLGVSVADAHIAAVLSATNGPHAVVTSDRKDLRRIASHLGIEVEIMPV
jgi:predicted nucleic acid-binding protein